MLYELARTHDTLRTTRSRTRKADILAAFLSRLPPIERTVACVWLSGELPQGRIGVGPALLRAVADTPFETEPTLGVLDVDRAFSEIAVIAGRGSKAHREESLRRVLARATAIEQRLLLQLLGGELRQGALTGVMVEAIARAASVPASAVRRALMLSGSIQETASAAFQGGQHALEGFRLEIFRPLQPMLAETADTVTEAIEHLGTAVFEQKLDGARVQVHKDGDRVRVYTRQLHEVTGAVPEVVESVRELPVERLVLDGEAIALRDGRPLPFQTTMRRFGRKLDVAAIRQSLPLSVRYFDCLLVDDTEALDLSLTERRALLERTVSPGQLIAAIETSDPDQAHAFLRETIRGGHEGVMAKGLGSPYAAGKRGADWLKLKPAYTLDLVVLAAEWGSGRRRGLLSNLHLGARDGAGFVMLGKTFKGLTDEVLTWQTEALLSREIGRDGHIVHVRPELVVEIAFNELQASSRYPGGLALRFARVRGYRPDKTAAEADTLQTVEAIHRRDILPL